MTQQVTEAVERNDQLKLAAAAQFKAAKKKFLQQQEEQVEKVRKETMEAAEQNLRVQLAKLRDEVAKDGDKSQQHAAVADTSNDIATSTTLKQQHDDEIRQLKDEFAKAKEVEINNQIPGRSGADCHDDD